MWSWGSNACDTKREPLEDVDCFKYLGPDIRNYLRIPYLMEIAFTTTGASKCGVRT